MFPIGGVAVVSGRLALAMWPAKSLALTFLPEVLEIEIRFERENFSIGHVAMLVV